MRRYGRRGIRFADDRELVNVRDKANTQIRAISLILKDLEEPAGWYKGCVKYLDGGDLKGASHVAGVCNSRLESVINVLKKLKQRAEEIEVQTEAMRKKQIIK